MAVFCHGGIIRVMLALLLEMPLMRMAHFNIEYGSLSVVEVQPEKKHAVEIEHQQRAFRHRWRKEKKLGR